MTDNKEQVFVAQYPPSGDLERWLYDQMVLIQQSIDTLRTSQGSWNNPKWNLHPSVSAERVKGAATPSTTYALNCNLYVFQDTYSSTESLVFNEQIESGWQEESSLVACLRTVNINSIAGDIVWGLTYRKSNCTSQPSSVTTIQVTQTLSGTANEVQKTEFAFDSMVGIGFAPAVFGELYRLSGDASDTATGGIALLSLNFLYKKNTDGSREKTAK